MALLFGHWLCLFLLSSVLSPVASDGQAATVVYSRDGACSGKEFIRSYTGNCTKYFNPKTNIEEYAKFSCAKENGFVIVETFFDSSCAESSGIVELLSNGKGITQGMFIPYILFTLNITLSHILLLCSVIFVCQVTDPVRKYMGFTTTTCQLNSSALQLTHNSFRPLVLMS